MWGLRFRQRLQDDALGSEFRVQGLGFGLLEVDAPLSIRFPLPALTDSGPKPWTGKANTCH